MPTAPSTTQAIALCSSFAAAEALRPSPSATALTGGSDSPLPSGPVEKEPGVWPRVSDQRVFLVALSGLIGLAWLSLWIWQQSPYSRFLSHRENEGVHALGTHYAALAVVFVAGWTLMTVAIMLP